MLKKVLFILASLMVGLLLVMNSIGSSFSSQVIKQTKNAVDSKDYTYAERFVSYALDDEKFYVGDIESTHIEIYSSITNKGYATKDDEGKVTGSYSKMEDCIQIALFHLPTTFATADKAVEEGQDPIQGGARLTLSNNEKVFVPFNDGVNNYYAYSEYYSMLPIFVFYDDYKEQIGSNAITSIEIIDGDGDVEFTIDTSEKPVSFNTDFHNDYYDLLVQYNELSVELDQEDEEQVAALRVVYDQIVAISDSGKYLVQHDVNIIYKSSGYIWSIVLTVVIFLAIDGALGFLLFRKKKAPAYSPKKPLSYGGVNNQKVNVNRAPEQFSRKDVFDAEEGTYVIEDKVATEESTEEKESEQTE